MGKFFKGQIKKDRTSLIKYGIIAFAALIVLILFIAVLIKGNKPKAELKLKDNIRFEVNSEKPKAEDFLVIKNFDKNKIKINYDELDMSKVGTYSVTIEAEGIDSGKATVEVYDETPPTLTLKTVTIDVGGTYTINDFVESCEDNSKEECILEYAAGLQDDTGNPIDYGAYINDGTYTVKIIAKDASGNVTEAKETNLIIGMGSPNDGNGCQYGNLSISEARMKYPLAVIVGDQNNNCALDKNLWDNASIQAPVTEFYNNDIEKLKPILENAIKKTYPDGATIRAYPHYMAMLNNNLTGLVGYAVYVKIYVAPPNVSKVDDDKYLAVSYYLNSDGTRQYETNKYNIK